MEGDLQHTLGRNLRNIRLARELSQEDFAEFLGVHRTYVGGVERGERNLSLRSVERLAEALDVSPLALLAEPVTALRAAADGTDPKDRRRAPSERPRPPARS